MSEDKIIQLDILKLADIFAHKNSFIGICENDIKTIKDEIKKLKKDTLNLEWPQRKEWISDEEYKKICSAIIWINRMALNKRIDEQEMMLKWVRKELKKHIKEKTQFIEFIENKSKKVYKYLLSNNLL